MSSFITGSLVALIVAGSSLMGFCATPSDAHMTAETVTVETKESVVFPEEAILLIAINNDLLQGRLSPNEATTLTSRIHDLFKLEDQYPGWNIPESVIRQEQAELDNIRLQMSKFEGNKTQKQYSGTAAVQVDTRDQINRMLDEGRVSMMEATALKDQINRIAAAEAWYMINGQTIPDSQIAKDFDELSELTSSLNSRPSMASRLAAK